MTLELIVQFLVKQAGVNKNGELGNVIKIIIQCNSWSETYITQQQPVPLIYCLFKL